MLDTPKGWMESSDQSSNSYEQARRQRIMRNGQILASLGLTNNYVVEQPRQTCASKKTKVSLPQVPTRRSKRQQGLSGELEAPSKDTLDKPTCKACLRELCFG